MGKTKKSKKGKTEELLPFEVYAPDPEDITSAPLVRNPDAFRKRDDMEDDMADAYGGSAAAPLESMSDVPGPSQVVGRAFAQQGDGMGEMDAQPTRMQIPVKNTVIMKTRHGKPMSRAQSAKKKKAMERASNLIDVQQQRSVQGESKAARKHRAKTMY